ncbi:MAG TPA: GNAT family N-acetyltransferase [Candidatus Faecimonas intestinavium]|nr:GNAT family N-acetyltransferase [Candidatus Faecimonas intestinavium]
MIIKVDKLDQLQALSRNQSLISIETMEHDLQVNPFGRYLLELENDKIIGYLYYSDIYDRAEINQIEVEVSHRNCGKATKLLQKMLELVEKSITLEVKKDNIPAINLYKKFGFQEKAIRQGYYQGIDGILMEREKDTK